MTTFLAPGMETELQAGINLIAVLVTLAPLWFVNVPLNTWLTVPEKYDDVRNEAM